MAKVSRKSGFAALVGWEISSVDDSAANEVILVLEDGRKFSINTETRQHLLVVTCTEIMKVTAKLRGQAKKLYNEWRKQNKHMSSHLVQFESLEDDVVDYWLNEARNTDNLDENWCG